MKAITMVLCIESYEEVCAMLDIFFQWFDFVFDWLSGLSWGTKLDRTKARVWFKAKAQAGEARRKKTRD
jgi:hypothetical protein